MCTHIYMRMHLAQYISWPLFMYISLQSPFRTPVLAVVCQTLTLPSNGLKHSTTNMLRCHVLQSTPVSQTPECVGGAGQMIPGTPQM